MQYLICIAYFCSGKLPEDGTPVPKHVAVWYLSWITRNECICWLIHRFDESWFDSRRGKESIFFSRASRPILKFTQLPVQWVNGAISTGYSGRVVKLTIHLYLMLRLRMSGAIPPFFPFKCKCGLRLLHRYISIQYLDWLYARI